MSLYHQCLSLKYEIKHYNNDSNLLVAHFDAIFLFHHVPKVLY